MAPLGAKEFKANFKLTSYFCRMFCHSYFAFDYSVKSYYPIKEDTIDLTIFRST